MRHAVLACLVLLGCAGAAAADPVIILVRHAERADGGVPANTMMAADPDLSPAGRVRADALARLLRDAGVSAIFTTELKRTQQTAAPLARLARVEPTVVPAAQPAELVKALLNVRGPAVVVGHSNTVPEIIAALGVPERVVIADEEYDNLFVVMRGDTPSLLRLRY